MQNEEEGAGRTLHNLFTEVEVGERDLEQGVVGVGPLRVVTALGGAGPAAMGLGTDAAGWCRAGGDAVMGGEGAGGRRLGQKQRGDEIEGGKRKGVKVS
jgi:hypothetical protein